MVLGIGFLAKFLSGMIYPPDKMAYVLYYNNEYEGIEFSKQYSTIQQILDDESLPCEGEFELTERTYGPLLKIFGLSIYTTDFHLIGHKCRSLDPISLKKCIKETYEKNEINKF